MLGEKFELEIRGYTILNMCVCLYSLCMIQFLHMQNHMDIEILDSFLNHLLRKLKNIH